MNRLKKQGTPKEQATVDKAEIERLFLLESFEKAMSDKPYDVFLGMTDDLLQFIDHSSDSQSKFFGVGYCPINNARLQNETDLKQRFLMKMAKEGFLVLDNFHVTEVNDDLDSSLLIPALLVHIEFDEVKIKNVLKAIKRELLIRLRQDNGTDLTYEYGSLKCGRASCHFGGIPADLIEYLFKNREDRRGGETIKSGKGTRIEDLVKILNCRNDSNFRRQLGRCREILKNDFLDSDIKVTIERVGRSLYLMVTDNTK